MEGTVGPSTIRVQMMGGHILGFGVFCGLFFHRFTTVGNQFEGIATGMGSADTF
jgi:hypothetical protein